MIKINLFGTEVTMTAEEAEEVLLKLEDALKDYYRQARTEKD